MTLATTTAPVTITQYEALESDIVIAEQQAIESFDYEDKKGNKAARSYLFELRKHKGRIETVRKDAKAYALEYGRQVDSQAKALVERIEALIAPHDEALKAIEQREAQRIAGHKAVIEAMGQAVMSALAPGITPAEVQELIDLVAGEDISQMEEFTTDAIQAKNAALDELERHLAAAQQREAEAAELARLREEARQRQEQEAEVQREAAARERAQREAQRALQQAQAREQAERDRAAQAEERARQAEEAARVAEEREQQRLAAEALAKGLREARQAELLERSKRIRGEKRALLIQELTSTMNGCNRLQVAELIADDKIHPAIRVAWGEV